MVLYRVFQEAAVEKHYSTIFSKATLFQIVVYVLMFVPPFFIAYSTSDFWHYTSFYQEQPQIQYRNQSVIQLGGNSQNTTVWSSFGSDVIVQGEELEPNIMFSEVDENGDGLNDVLNLTIVFQNLSHSVQTIQMFLFFQVDLNRFGFLEQFSRLTLQSATYTSESWNSPASSLWLGGELELKQTVPLPASGIVSDYDVSPVNNSVSGTLGITDVLSRYNERNVRILWNNQYPVWSNGETSTFVVQIELKYPIFTIIYQPNFWQYLKFAWVQYLALFVVFWWVLSYAQSFVFANQVILTCRKQANKWHID